MTGNDDGMAQVAAAWAQLEVARREGRSGGISAAWFQLAATLAALGDAAAAAEQYRELLGYLDLARADRDAETQRMLRRLSPAAPPPDVDDVDPQTLATLARIRLAEALIALGRADEARAELAAAEPGTKGLGRGPLRRELAAVHRTLSGGGERSGVPPQLAAADELLGREEYPEAARVALQVIQRCDDDQVALRARARQVLGMALEAMGRVDDAVGVFAQAFSDYLAADEPVPAAAVAITLAWHRNALGERAAAVTTLRRALDVLGTRAGADTRVRLLVDLGSLLDPDDRAAACDTLQAAVDSATTPVLRADAQHGLAVVLAGSSDPEDSVEALALLDDCRSVYDDHALRDRAAGCEHEAAALLGRLRSWDAAEQRYRRALARYTGLPEDERDTGSWPDEVADCELNLSALARPDPLDRIGDPRLFRSGGHAMTHR